MTTLTFEALTAAEAGATINVTGVGRGAGQWTRVEAGLQQESSVLPLAAFEGLARAGNLSLHRPIDSVPVGSTHTDGRWHYMLADRVNEELVLAIFRNDTWQGHVGYGVNQLNNFRWVDPTPESLRALALSQNIRRLERESVESAERHRLAMREQQALVQEANGRTLAQQEVNQRQAREASEKADIPATARAALHEYASAVDDDEFDEVLASIGIGRDLVHEVHVSIEGQISVEPVFDFGSSDFSVDDTEYGTVYWSREVTIEKRGVGCQCEDVTRDDLTQYLPVGVGSWEFTVDH